MRLISILLFFMLGACAHKPVPHTYLKYSGYMEGCARATIELTISLVPEIETSDDINYIWLDAMCMELYLIKLEVENIKPPMIRIEKDTIL